MKISSISYHYNYKLVANRYYNSRISKFYATDPLAEKYPNFSPYTYTVDNPVMLVDPDGRKIKVSFRTGFLGIFGKKVTLTYDPKNQQWIDANGKKYTGKMSRFARISLIYLNNLNKSSYTFANKLISELADSKFDFYLKSRSRSFFKARSMFRAQAKYLHSKVPTDMIGSGGTIFLNPSGMPVFTKKGIQRNPKTGLFHEFVHAYDAMRGLLAIEKYKGLKGAEWRAVYYENLYRKTEHLPLRPCYGYSKFEIDDGFHYTPNPPHTLDDNGNPVLPEIFNFE